MSKKTCSYAAFNHLIPEIFTGIFALLFLGTCIAPVARAQRQELGATNLENPFEEAYWGLELTSNSPVDKTSRHLEPGTVQPQVSYRYRLSTGWLLGAHAGFKSLRRKFIADDEPRQLSILTFGYESLKGWRIYHPLYFFAGGKLQYLLPAVEATLPVRRDPEYPAEFGAAAVAMLAIKPAGSWLMVARLDRWRGLATTRLQGDETSIGLMYSF
ncbi:hypothetical protein EBZ80_00315 [bacterium]|nr:hypothetical protein [bacterium]